MKKQTGALLRLTVSMLIFGTIGIFRHFTELSSGMLAMIRGFTGSVFLAAVMLLCRQKPGFKEIKKKLPALVISGALIGFNWILLFEAYENTTVSKATLCYYMAPVIVILLSPVVLKEKLTLKKGLCSFFAVAGVVLISGVFSSSGDAGGSETAGILFGLGAAALYAAVILINRFLGSVKAFDKTVIQLFSAAVTIMPYVIATEDFSAFNPGGRTIALALVIGIVHTGIAYALYFGAISSLEGQTVAVFSYIDPVTAVLLSSVFYELLGEKPADDFTVTGAVLVLGSAFVSEVNLKKIKKKV